MRKKWFYILCILLLVAFLLFLKDYNETTLRKLADDQSSLIGASIRYNPLLEENEYKETIKEEFNTITVENKMKFKAIHPGYSCI